METSNIEYLRRVEAHRKQLERKRLKELLATQSDTFSHYLNEQAEA